MFRSTKVVPLWASSNLPSEPAAACFQSALSEADTDSGEDTCSESQSSPSTDSEFEAATRPPSLYPCYLPSKSQHLLLTTTQALLEACCFGFAQEKWPNLVLEKQWDSAAAVDLHSWTKILGTMERGGTLAASDIDFGPFHLLLTRMRLLRDVTVRRTKTTARDLSQLLYDARRFCALLHDEERAATIGRMKDALDDAIYSLEQAKKTLESRTWALLQSLEEERALLRQRGEGAVASMLLANMENVAVTGQALEASMTKIIQGDGNCGAGLVAHFFAVGSTSQ